MGILDDLRMATGLALEPAEAYTRAFEKGVLLGPKHSGEAADLFNVAAQKLVQAEEPAAMAQRAAAKREPLCRSSRTPRARCPPPHLRRCKILAHLPYIETPGTIDEIIEGPV